MLYLQLYNTALSDTEVKSLYSGGSVPFRYKVTNFSEKIAGGDFAAAGSWAYQSGWAHDTDKATFTAGGGDAAVHLHEDNMVSHIEVNKTYNITFKISTATAEF